MAKSSRSRDYRAEEARRNARARELGFTSRAHMRRALRQGWQPVRKTERPTSPIVGGVTPAPPSGSVARLRRESQKWSDQHSRQDTSRYSPDFSAATVRKYHAAFINPQTRASRIENGFDALREYLVDEKGFYTDVEFIERYGLDAYAF